LRGPRASKGQGPHSGAPVGPPVPPRGENSDLVEIVLNIFYFAHKGLEDRNTEKYFHTNSNDGLCPWQAAPAGEIINKQDCVASSFTF